MQEVVCARMGTTVATTAPLYAAGLSAVRERPAEPGRSALRIGLLAESLALSIGELAYRRLPLSVDWYSFDAA